eukprot:9474492-Pyramimonas_sp.AAC.1
MDLIWCLLPSARAPARTPSLTMTTAATLPGESNSPARHQNFDTCTQFFDTVLNYMTRLFYDTSWRGGFVRRVDL